RADQDELARHAEGESPICEPNWAVDLPTKKGFQGFRFASAVAVELGRFDDPLAGGAFDDELRIDAQREIIGEPFIDATERSERGGFSGPLGGFEYEEF